MAVSRPHEPAAAPTQDEPPLRLPEPKQGGHRTAATTHTPTGEARQPALQEETRGGGPREGSGVPQGPEPRSDRHGSPELLDLAGGALQALEHQVHAAVAQLIGAEAELRQGGVGPERGTDVLAPHLREATVVQPADGHSVTSHSRL